MSNIINENEKGIIINNNVITSIKSDSEDSNNNVINLKMRKIHKRRNSQNNSEKIRIELKKLLGDLQNSKFTKDKIILKEKIKQLKLTPFQKILKENAKIKKALFIKINRVLNPNNLEYVINLNNIKNKKYKDLKIKNINDIKNFNISERSITYYNKSFFELNKNNSKLFNKKSKLFPNVSRNINSYRKFHNNDFNYFKSQKNNVGVRQKFNNLLSPISRQLIINDKPQNNSNNLNTKKKIDKGNQSKTYSKIHLKIPIINKKENIVLFNKYINTDNIGRNNQRLKRINFITDTKIYSNLNKKTKSKKIVINKPIINRVYISSLLNKVLYKNENFNEKSIKINYKH